MSKTETTRGPIEMKDLTERWPAPDRAAIETLLAKEAASSRHKIVVLDDDPTGIQTVHGISVFTDWSEAAFAEGFAETAPVFFVLTNSRGMTAAESQAAHREMARNLAAASKKSGKPYILVSRSDSTLRGHYPLETETLRESLEAIDSIPFDGEIIFPFFKEGGRFTVDGTHYVQYGGTLMPAGDTEFAKDKTFGYVHSFLPDWIEEKTEGRYPAVGVVRIGLEDLRAVRIEKINRALSNVADFGKVVVDALDYCDVQVFCAALLQAIGRGKRFMFRSAAAVPKVLGRVPDKPILSRDELVDPAVERGGLVVIGSHVKKTSAQLEELRKVPDIVFIEFDTHLVLDGPAFGAEIARVDEEADKALGAGLTTVIYTRRDRFDVNTGDKEDELKVSLKIAGAVTSFVSSLKERPRFIIAKGGITSSEIGTAALRVKKATVLGQALPGIPVWLTGPESRFPNTPYIIFPGNVGGEDALKVIVERLR